MSTLAVVLVIAWAVVLTLWILAVTYWRPLTLKRLAAGSAAWFWMRLCGVAEIESNRGRYLIYISILGMVIMTTLVFALIAFAEA